MLEIFLLGIGFVLVFEGIMYFFTANKIKFILEQLNQIDPQRIKSISLIMIVIGISIIYFTLKFYGDY